MDSRREVSGVAQGFIQLGSSKNGRVAYEY